MSDSIKVKPIAPSLTQSDSPRPKRARRFPWALALIPVVLVTAYFVFQFLPQEGLRTGPSADSTDKTNISVSNDESTLATPTVLPFEDSELRRAEERAKDILQLFSILQDKVEEEELGLAESRERYNAIIDAANDADSAFAKREFETAIQEYEAARQMLEAYVNDHEFAFEDFFEKGNNALVARNLNDARSNLTQAALIKPKDIDLAGVLERLEKLPEVNRLIRESQRASLQGDIEKAKSLLEDVLVLDSNTSGLDEKLEELQKLDSNDVFNRIISNANAALNRQDLIAAQSLFGKALEMRPNDQAAKSGLSRTEQQLTLVEISKLKAIAEQQESNNEIEAAFKTYVEALALDPNLQFAREGKLRTETTVKLTAALDRVIADPDMLSSISEFEAAQSVLDLSRAHFDKASDQAKKITRLAELIAIASNPLPIVLISDNEMEVRLATVGDLGPFTRKELSLRPGRYLLTGSANGCRDVRKTIIVSEGMSPISIRCNEPI